MALMLFTTGLSSLSEQAVSPADATTAIIATTAAFALFAIHCLVFIVQVYLLFVIPFMSVFVLRIVGCKVTKKGLNRQIFFANL
jgi:hypothetical protein